MFFLLRMAFWLTIVLAILPTGSSQPQAQADMPQIDAVDTLVAAGAAVSDMSSFCDRQPEACKVGVQAAAVIGQRAQAGAGMVYDFIQERVIQERVIKADSRTETGSVGSAAKVVPASMSRSVSAHPGSMSTLRPSDLEPAWQAMQPRHEAMPAAVPLPRPRPKQSV